MKQILYLILLLLILPCLFGICKKMVSEKQYSSDSVTVVISDTPSVIVEDLTSCEDNVTVTETNHNVGEELHLPSWVISRYGKYWTEHRLCEVDDRVYYYAHLMESRKTIIYDQKHVIFNGDNLEINKVNEKETTRFLFCTPFNYVDVDFTLPSQISQFRELSPKVNPNFVNYAKGFDTKIPYSLTYHISIDYPSDSSEISSNIRKWLIYLISKSQNYTIDIENLTSLYIGYKKKNFDNWMYDGSETDIKGFVKFAADKFFSVMKKEHGEDDEPFPVYLDIELKNVYDNGKFITYQVSSEDYNGGAHGYPTENLYSFDYFNNEEITLEYLFGSIRTPIIDLMLQTAQSHPRFQEFHNTETLDDVRRVFSENDDKGRMILLPSPGLGVKGVVFSYQPYELGSYVERLYHFCIPYSKLKPYMTEKAKQILDII